MTTVISITQLRKDLFDIAEKVAVSGEEIEIEKEGKRIVKIVPIKDDPAAKAQYVIKYVLPELSGVLKNIPQKELVNIRNLRRSRQEKVYWKRKIFK